MYENVDRMITVTGKTVPRIDASAQTRLLVLKIK